MIPKNCPIVVYSKGLFEEPLDRADLDKWEHSFVGTIEASLLPDPTERGHNSRTSGELDVGKLHSVKVTGTKVRN